MADAAALGAVAVAAGDLVAVVLDLGEAVLVAEAGFLAAAVVAAVELLFTLVGEPALEVPGPVEVRRAVPVVEELDSRGFFSSSDTDG